MADDLYLIRNNNQTWAKIDQVVAVTLGGGGDLSIYSPEFRDIFQSTFSSDNTDVGASSTTTPSLISMAQNTLDSYGLNANSSAVAVTSLSNSDEVAHTGLRQSVLTVTFWQFDLGSGETPRYLYAEYQEGDIIADNPPQTP